MKIIIVRLSAMGDIVNSAFILQFIKEAYPEAEIDWVCEEVFAPLLDHHPLIHKVHTVNLKKIKKDKSLFLLRKTIKKLKRLDPYDVVIDLQGLIKSAIISRYLGKKRFGFDKNSIREPLASLFYTHKINISYAKNSLWRTAHLVNKALDLDITADSIDQKDPILFHKQGSKSNITSLLKGKNILFVTGSSQAYKNY